MSEKKYKTLTKEQFAERLARSPFSAKVLAATAALSTAARLLKDAATCKPDAFAFGDDTTTLAAELGGFAHVVDSIEQGITSYDMRFQAYDFARRFGVAAGGAFDRLAGQ